jgi:hypothetical protein
MYIYRFSCAHSGDPLYVGMDITIASFDAISEVNMASHCFSFYDPGTFHEVFSHLLLFVSLANGSIRTNGPNRITR